MSENNIPKEEFRFSEEDHYILIDEFYGGSYCAYYSDMIGRSVSSVLHHAKRDNCRKTAQQIKQEILDFSPEEIYGDFLRGLEFLKKSHSYSMLDVVSQKDLEDLSKDFQTKIGCKNLCDLLEFYISEKFD